MSSMISDVPRQICFPHPAEAEGALALVGILLGFFRRVLALGNVVIASKALTLGAPLAPLDVGLQTLCRAVVWFGAF